MKYLFVHIAKTAGTSVNSVFQDVLGAERCLVHVESEPDWNDPVRRGALTEGKNFISGHRTLTDFSEKLNLSEFFVFTFLRDPVAHVVSHLAWIRRLREPGHEQDFLDHPEYIQKLATKLSQVDFGNDTEVSQLVDNLSPVEFALLDNPQVRYLRKRHAGAVSESDVDHAVEGLEAMGAFGLVEAFDNGLRRICAAAAINAPEKPPRDNVRQATDGPLSVSNEGLISALYPLIRFDMILYRQAEAQTLARHEDALAPAARSIEELEARVDDVREGKVFGWARFGFSQEPVRLDIYVNGAFFKSVLADKSRSDLKEKFGLNCAFECDISSFDKITSISVRENLSGSHLKNSPFNIGS
ncbi:hypothetical protein [Marinobacter sp. MBR-105]|jgi:hypothetical protein